MTQSLFSCAVLGCPDRKHRKDRSSVSFFTRTAVPHKIMDSQRLPTPRDRSNNMPTPILPRILQYSLKTFLERGQDEIPPQNKRRTFLFRKWHRHHLLSDLVW